MDAIQRQNEIEEKLNTAMNSYHNAIYQVCKEGGNWVDANNKLKEMLGLYNRYTDIAMVAAKEALEKAFTPRLRKMLEDKINEEKTDG